jgi:predicted protein tyrosine phosphatase
MKTAGTPICNAAERHHEGSIRQGNLPLGPFSAFRIATCGVSDLSQHSATEFSHVLSILDPRTPRPEALSDFTTHCRLELRFHDIITTRLGAVPPNADHIEQILAFGRKVSAIGDTAHLLVHCHAGQSRSTAAAALCLAQAYPIRTAYEVVGEIVRRHPSAWPNLLMLELGDEALGRQGEFIAAAGALYRRAIDANPSLGDHMKRHGRDREVALAEHWR